MLTVIRYALIFASLALVGSGCRVCGGWSHPDDFVLQKATSHSSAGTVLFEIHATSSLDGATALSDERVVLKSPGDTGAVPSSAPWALELLTDANGDGMIEAGDVIQVVQLANVAGGIETTSGRSYDVALLTHVTQDGVVSDVTEWQSTWTVP